MVVNILWNILMIIFDTKICMFYNLFTFLTAKRLLGLEFYTIINSNKINIFVLKFLKIL